MKTFISCSLAGFTLLANTVSAGGLEGYGIPSNISLYGGVGGGISNHEGACVADSATTDCEDSDTGYKVFTGLRATPLSNGFVRTPTGTIPTKSLPTLGAEIGHIDLGESTARGHVGRPAPGGFDSELRSELSANYIAGVAHVPVMPRTELLGKVGAAYWKQKGSRAVPENPDDDLNTRNSGVGMLLGTGVQVQINPNFAIRGEYEHLFGTAEDSEYEADAGMLSIGAVFSTF